MNEEEAELLPPYLRPYPPSGAPLGTLSYNRRSKCWVVKGDPSVTEVCKRLFPGSAGSRRGEARFTAHRRTVGDLCWLMMRFPLEIKASDRALWEKAVTGAREYAVRQAKMATMPVRMTPPDGAFLGTLRPFQEEGLSYLCSHDRCLLADEMGLGKTVQALAFLASTGALPALVIPPAHLTRNWQEETLRFLRVDGKAPRVHVIKGLKPYDLPEADVYIMHYLLLRGWKNVLPTLPFRAVIFDEIQELRHAGTEKYSAASLLSESCERVVGLSGTPIYNRGGEIWNVINILDYHFLGDWESFSREWCSGYGNQIVLKPDLLGAYLRREGLMLRRTKQEVLRELPPKRRLVQELDWNDKVYAQLMAPVMHDVLRWKQDDHLSAQERAMLEESISQHARQATGVAKAPYVCQFVRALLDGGEKVLLFAHHHQVMDIYKQELKSYSPGFITGRETTLAKMNAVDRFQAGRTDVLCISLRAASGLNLQRATCVVFGELDWSPAVHSQAEDRAHRMGQEDSLLCYYLVAPQGSDAVMQEALGLKVSQFVGLMGDAPQSPEQAEQFANQARRHVERIVAQMGGDDLIRRCGDTFPRGEGKDALPTCSAKISGYFHTRRARRTPKPSPLGKVPQADEVVLPHPPTSIFLPRVTLLFCINRRRFPMLYLGCHLSASAGYLHMGQEALSIGANTFQFFTRNPRGGTAKPLDLADVAAYLDFAQANGIGQIVAHAPYTLNGCSADPAIRDFARRTMLDDLQRLDHLPGNLYNFHPGSHVKQGVEVATEQICDMLNAILWQDMKTTVLLETMAGKGSEVGRTFEELRAIIDRTELGDKLGVCLDTCHVSDAGYDIVNHLEDVLADFDRVIGLNRLKAIHLNDSKNPCGAHKDRHEQIGKGYIGLEALMRVVNHPSLKHLPFELETPNDLAGYAAEIKQIRELAE